MKRRPRPPRRPREQLGLVNWPTPTVRIPSCSDCGCQKGDACDCCTECDYIAAFDLCTRCMRRLSEPLVEVL